MGRVGYVVKDKNDVIKLGSDVCLELSTNEETVEKSVNIMKEIEKSDGFMFWNVSPEGEEFYEKNWGLISESLTRIILNQK